MYYPLESKSMSISNLPSKKDAFKKCSDKQDSIFIRPHHGMCLAYFKGVGYSDAFSVHMKKMLDILEKGATVKLHVDTDAICFACPNNKNGHCESRCLVAKYDRDVLSMCHLTEGEEIDFHSFTAKVQKHILAAGKRSEICAGCKWEYICEHTKSRWEQACTPLDANVS